MTDLDIFVLYFLTIPVYKLELSSVLMDKLYIPDFIIAELYKLESTAILVIIGTILAFYLNLQLNYFIPLMSFKNLTAKEVMAESWHQT